MKRSTIALIALLIVAGVALVISWSLLIRRPAAGEPTDAGPPAVTATTAAAAASQTSPAEPATAPTEISDKPLPAFLTALLDPAHDPTRHASRASLTVVFDRPVADPAPSRPLAFAPAVAGTFSWNDDRTALTFNPTRGFAAGTRYRFSVASEVRGADGTKLDGQPTWWLEVVTPPEVVGREPALGRAANRQPTFILTFNRPMDAATVAVSVDPDVALDVAWADETTLTVRPIAPLNPGEFYDFVISATAADAEGIALGQAYRWRYIPAAVMTAVEGPSRFNRDAPVRLTFGYPMDRAAVEAALIITPPLDGERRWIDDNTMEISDAHLLGNTRYRFSLAWGVRDAAGALLPAPDEPLIFGTEAPLLAVAPGGNSAHPAEQLRWVFDRPMDPATTADALAIEPNTPGEISWADDNTLLFTPDGGYWQPLTRYTVTLDTGATDAGGHPVIGEPLVQRFTTGEERRLADWGIGPQTQVLDADGRRAVQFQSSVETPVTLSFDLLPVDQTGFLNRLVGDVTSSWSGPAEPIADDGLSPIASWTTTTLPADPDIWANPQETLIPADAPPGLYLLRLNGPDPANLLLALTRMTLVAKLSAGEMVVWVTDIPVVDELESGAAVPGAAVQVYAQNGALLAEGATDDRGVTRLPLDADAEPYVVFAQSGEDITFSALTPELQARGEYYDWSFWAGGQPVTSFAPPAFALHLQTDRPIYRPGQTVHYKAIVRYDDDGAVSLPPLGTQVIVRLIDSRDNVVRTRFLATDEFGAVYDAFDVAEGAMLGEYTVEVQPVTAAGAPDEAKRQTFQVEEYRKPDFSVSVTPATPDMVAGDTISVTVEARYLFGEPVADADITFRRFRLYEWFDYWSGGEEFWEEWYEETPLTATTDADGRAVIAIPAVPRDLDYSWWSGNPMSWRMAIEATVNDGSNQTVSASAVVTIHRAAEVLTLEDTPEYFIEFGDEANFLARVTTTIGGENAPVAGRAIRGTLRAWSNETYDYSSIVADYEWTTDENGQISAFLTPPATGYYRLRLGGVDDGGRLLFAETYIYVLDEGESSGWWWNGPTSSITISADQADYAPGDTARLLVAADFAGPALLTLERATVRREIPVMLTPPVTVIELPILPEDAPNVHATINAWRPITTTPPDADIEENWLLTESQRDAELHRASVELVVPITDRTLTVAITTDRDAYAPGEEAAITVQVTDAAGQPVSAQVALAMVDEAIFLLADDNTRPLHDAFYGRRPNRVQTRDALAPGRYLYQGGMGGGGGDAFGAPRSDFPDTAQWLPALVTGADGRITVNVPLADSLTTWRLTARAVTADDTSVGEAVHKISTHQEIIVRPVMPRGLTVGDEAVLTAVVHNYGADAAELAVWLVDSAGALAVTEPLTQLITLEPGATRVVGWPITALAEVAAPIEVRAARPDGSGDAVALNLDVRELAVPIHAYTTGVVDGARTVDFDVPADALPSSVVSIDVSRSPAGSLLNGLEYLTGFPYGCVEQTMSRALPNAVVSRAFNALNVPPPDDIELDELVNESAQKLYGFQHDDGGWGWWFDDNSDVYQTAWVLFGLATMADAGHEIDPDVIARGADYLRQRLDTAEPLYRAYMLFSLAAAQPILEEAGFAPANNTEESPPVDEAAAARRLLAELEGNNPVRLDAFSLAALALALDAYGETDGAGRVLDMLAATAELGEDAAGNSTAHWGTTGDGQYDRKTMASATRSTALALSAFVRLRPGSELEPLLVNYLMERRRGNGWGTTNETAHAIIGLTDHLLAAGLGRTAAAYTVTLNGEPLAEGALEAAELRDVIAIPSDRLRPGQANSLELAAADGGRLYYVINGRYRAARETIEADGPVVVTRSYHAPNGSQQTLTEIGPGDLVLVRLVVRAPREMSFVVIEDPTPAGLEAVNERLNTSTHQVQRDYSDPNWQLYRWQDYGYNHKEIREGRVSFFVTTLPIGVSQFEYLARATHEGTFAALPAEAWAMYELELWGRSGSDELRVTSDE